MMQNLREKPTSLQQRLICVFILSNICLRQLILLSWQVRRTSYLTCWSGLDRYGLEKCVRCSDWPASTWRILCRQLRSSIPHCDSMSCYEQSSHDPVQWIWWVMTRAYTPKKRACNCTPSNIQTVPNNSNSVYSKHWRQASYVLYIVSITTITFEFCKEYKDILLQSSLVYKPLLIVMDTISMSCDQLYLENGYKIEIYSIPECELSSCCSSDQSPPIRNPLQQIQN